MAFKLREVERTRMLKVEEKTQPTSAARKETCLVDIGHFIAVETERRLRMDNLQCS